MRLATKFLHRSSKIYVPPKGAKSIKYMSKRHGDGRTTNVTVYSYNRNVQYTRSVRSEQTKINVFFAEQPLLALLPTCSTFYTHTRARIKNNVAKSVRTHITPDDGTRDFIVSFRFFSSRSSTPDLFPFSRLLTPSEKKNTPIQSLHRTRSYRRFVVARRSNRDVSRPSITTHSY